MKKEDLEGIGLTEEQVNKIISLNEADINAEKTKTTKAEGERDNFKTQLDTATEQLSKLGDLKPEDVKNTIKKLQEDLKAKDDEYAKKEADRAFSDALSEAIKAAGGKNTKAIMALLDIDALKASKDQTTDIKKALETTKESDAYLFGAEEPINNPILPTNGDGGGDNLSAIRAAMGLPVEKK